MSLVNCGGHSKRPWGFNPFGENKEPTNEEINKHRLYKCSRCKQWFSLLPSHYDVKAQEAVKQK